MSTLSPPGRRLPGASQEPSPALEAIYGRIRRTMPHLCASLRPDATFAECGGDSLDLVELCCAVDSDYGIRLTVEDLASVRAMVDLVSLIDQRAVRRPAEISS